MRSFFLLNETCCWCQRSPWLQSQEYSGPSCGAQMRIRTDDTRVQLRESCSWALIALPFIVFGLVSPVHGILLIRYVMAATIGIVLGIATRSRLRDESRCDLCALCVLCCGRAGIEFLATTQSTIRLVHVFFGYVFEELST